LYNFEFALTGFWSSEFSAMHKSGVCREYLGKDKKEVCQESLGEDFEKKLNIKLEISIQKCKEDIVLATYK